MASIQKIKSKKRGIRYRVRIARQGQKVISATFDKRTKADAFIREYDTSQRATKYLDKQESKKHTLSDAIERYIQEGQADDLKSKSDKLRQLNTFNELFGYLRLSELFKPAIVSEIESKLRNRTKGKKLTNATVNRYFSALSSLCQIAYENWYWLESNPIRNYRKKKEDKNYGRCLTENEFEKLKKACKLKPKDQISIVVTIALCTGMRKGEIRYLKWENINLKQGVISLKNTKNGSPRTVPIVEPALSMLKAHSKIRRIKTDWVFNGRDSEKTGMPFNINKPWVNLRDSLEITNFRFHDLRHTCASFLAKNKVNTRLIAEILGHKTLAMAMRYSHLNVEDQRESLEIMTKKVFIK